MVAVVVVVRLVEHDGAVAEHVGVAAVRAGQHLGAQHLVRRPAGDQLVPSSTTWSASPAVPTSWVVSTTVRPAAASDVHTSAIISWVTRSSPVMGSSSSSTSARCASPCAT